MFNPKYYDNPFANDDDDVCYGEILSDNGDTATHTGASSAGGREKRFSVPPVSATASGSRRALESATEIPLSAMHNTEDWDGPRRGEVDSRDYEEYIAELRSELEGANAENRRLTAAQTKAEARARTLLFEKENAEWQLQQERERNSTLAEKVAALEAELDQLTTRASSAAGQRKTAAPSPVEQEARSPGLPQWGHVDPHAPLAENGSSAPDSSVAETMQTPLQDRQRGTRARAQFEQRQAAYLESRGGPHDRAAVEATPPVQRGDTVASSLTESVSSGLTRSLRGQRRAEAVQEQLLQKERAAKEDAVAVQELDALLQTHCQKRDELAQQLQRLESMRLRSVAERRKKAAVEVELEEEEKTIGQIRLELRSRSALLR